MLTIVKPKIKFFELKPGMLFSLGDYSCFWLVVSVSIAGNLVQVITYNMYNSGIKKIITHKSRDLKLPWALLSDLVNQDLYCTT